MTICGCISYAMANVRETTSRCRACLNLIYIQSATIVIVGMWSSSVIFLLSKYLVTTQYLKYFQGELMLLSQPNSKKNRKQKMKLINYEISQLIQVGQFKIIHKTEMLYVFVFLVNEIAVCLN